MNFLTTLGGTLKEHSPAILLGAGLIGFGATIFAACKATLKVEKIIEESNQKAEMIKEYTPDPELVESGEIDDYTEEDRANDLKLNTFQTRCKIAKNYIFAALLGVASVASILVAFKILNGRYLVATSAFAALEKFHNKYTERIKQEYGEDADYYAATGIKRVHSTVDVTDIDENNNVTTHTEELNYNEVVVPDDVREDPYSFLIGPGDYLYDKFGGDMSMISQQIKVYQNGLNDRYSKGECLIMNEDVIRQIFGGATKKMTDICQISGWCRDDKVNKNNTADHVELNFDTIMLPTMDGTDEIKYGIIRPNCGLVSFANINKTRHNLIQHDKVKVRRKSGKYISK